MVVGGDYGVVVPDVEGLPAAEVRVVGSELSARSWAIISFLASILSLVLSSWGRGSSPSWISVGANGAKFGPIP